MATAPPGDRFVTLDVLRGVAVIGILVINIGDFAMPSEARLNPLLSGGGDPLDLTAWAVNWVVFDNKMRGLFSLLFGASLLVVSDRAAASGRSPWRVQVPRLLVLLALGAAHAAFIWDGDILVLYAAVGLVAVPYTRAGCDRIRRGAAIAFAAAFLLMVLAGAGAWARAGADPDAAQAELVNSARVDTLAAARPYPDQLAARARGLVEKEPAAVLFGAPDTLGLMLLGMVLLRAGLLTGTWERPRAWRLAARAGVAGPGAARRTGGVAVGEWLSASADASHLLRPRLPVQHRADRRLDGVVVRLGGECDRLAGARAGGHRARRLHQLHRHVGRDDDRVSTAMAAGCTVRSPRWQAWLFVIGGGLLMLAWSRPWLTRFRYGPLEWL